MFTLCFSFVGSLRWLLSLVALAGVTLLIKVGSKAGRLTREWELHPGLLLGTDGTHWGWKPEARAGEENHRDAAVLMWLSGEKSPLATDIPSKWRQFYSPSTEWLANVPIPSFFTCMPPSQSYDVWAKPNRNEREGGGVYLVEDREAISVCLLKLVLKHFSVRFLSRGMQEIWFWKSPMLSKQNLKAGIKQSTWKGSA